MKYVALLRGINVSGQKKIAMVDLRQLFERIGLIDVTTYIQSGNVVFSSVGKSVKNLEKQIEDALESEYAYAVAVIVKSAGALNEILANNPFDDEAVYFTIFKTVPETVPEDKIAKVKKPEEELRIRNDVAFLKCPNGYGKTKLSNSYLEKISSCTATTRNMKTLRTLVVMMQ